MIPLDQTDTTSTSGNCLQASFASLIETALEEVPHFALMEGDDWWYAQFRFIHEWSKGALQLGLRPRSFPVYSEDDAAEDHARRYVIGCGPSPRGDWHHAVVLDAQTGYLAHDPHPTDKQGIGSDGGYVLALYANPAGIGPSK